MIRNDKENNELLRKMDSLRYKKRLQKEIVKNYERESKDSTEYEYASLRKR
ncbi:MAG: hypothetical protein QOC35_03880 [Nitrososphaeraceae archaeon]|nr:hypothetical protein [Nitrososphaeraceae archaeon]